MTQKQIWLIAGLGNPGPDYHETRHNIGFMTIDYIGASFFIDTKKYKFDARYGRGQIEDREVILAKPCAYMNRSGPPLAKLGQYFKCTKLIVIHDDLDIAFGSIKIKQQGGDGGHRGLRSIIGTLGTREFARVRIGIGRPQQPNIEPADYVLEKFKQHQQDIVDKAIKTAGEAVLNILCKGTEKSMNKFNQKQPKISREE